MTDQEAEKEGEAASMKQEATSAADRITSAAHPHVLGETLLTRANRQKRRARTRSALWLLGVSGVVVPLTWIDGVVGVGCAFGWLLLSLHRALSESASLPHPIVIVDREIETRPLRSIDYEAPSPLLFANELEALALGAGVRPLGSFQEPLRAGAARHDPGDGIASIDAILAAGALLPGEVVSFLECVRERLVIAQSAQARFCLVQLAGWSGVVETNLRLYWYG